jgi:hypothetical protein
MPDFHCEPFSISLEFSGSGDTTVIVELDYSEKLLGTWERIDSQNIHAFDEFSMWNDENYWDDGKYIYDSNVYELYVTATPIEDMGWFSTLDGLAFATSNDFLFGVSE